VKEKLIRIQTPARAGLLGNPSDGFYGKTLSIPIRNFHAEVILFEWERIEILPGPSDHVNFDSLKDLIRDIQINGYYGGFRLIKAAIKQFSDYINTTAAMLPSKQFTIRYTSNIPRQVGLAGSSAIITSTMKALAEFYGVPMSKPQMANYVLWSESKELGISAGLQDRVVQVYDEPVFMDFDEPFMNVHGYGQYSRVAPKLFPPLFLAYRTELTHKDVAHNDVQLRWERGEPEVRKTMGQLAANAQTGYDALKTGDLETFDTCINKNFDLRAQIYPITKINKQMIDLARNLGATAKFPGSGGAIIGTYKNKAHFQEMKMEFAKIGCELIQVLI